MRESSNVGEMGYFYMRDIVDDNFRRHCHNADFDQLVTIRPGLETVTECYFLIGR